MCKARFPFKRENFTQQTQAPANRNARSKQWQPWLAACQRKRLRFLRFSFTQRTQRKRLRLDGNRAWLCIRRCACVNTEIARSKRNEAGQLKTSELTSTADVLASHRDVTAAVGVALCVLTVVIATIFIWHSSRHCNCTVSPFATFKMAAVTVAPSKVVIAPTGNSNSAKVNTTPSSGAILVPNRVHGRQQRLPSEPRVVIGRSASRDARTGARDDVTSASTALHVSLNRLPLGDLLGPTNYIPYRLKQSYC